MVIVVSTICVIVVINQILISERVISEVLIGACLCYNRTSAYHV
jgi:hypothetical protein